MKTILYLPLVIPFSAGLLLLLFRDRLKWQKGISAVAMLFLVVATFQLFFAVHKEGILVTHMGNWPAPFGIIFAVDLLGAIMTLLTALVGLTALVYSFQTLDFERLRGFYYALFFFLLFGVNGAFMTGDLFNLFVFFEIVLMTSYVLLVLGNEHKQVHSGLVYLSLNLFGSTLFLVGAGILFGLLGTLNMAHIADRIDSVGHPGLITLVAIIFFFVFGLKGAMFPINNWLPDAYTSPPTPVSAIFAGLLTKVGVYSMYRAFVTIFSNDISFTHHTLLLPLAGLTMLVGVWGAVVQYDVRSILAYHSISQVGYMLMGLAIYAPLAIAGGIFHMIHHSLVKSSLFLIGGGMGQGTGSQNLKKCGGLVSLSPVLALLFMISALALAGVPPLSGFFSKFALVMSGLTRHHPLLVTAALITSLFTLYSMIKIWRLGFWGTWKKAKDEFSNKNVSQVMGPIILSVVLVLLLSIFSGPIMRVSKSASDQLLDRDFYIQKVLESRPLPMESRGDISK